MGTAADLNALTVLSYIDARVETGASHRDRLGIYYPLLLEAVTHEGDGAFTTTDLRTWLKGTYRLDIPDHVISILLGRAAKEGYVRKDKDGFWWSKDPIPENELPVPDESFEEDYEALLQGLVEFFADESEGDVDREMAQNCLASFLERNFGQLAYSDDGFGLHSALADDRLVSKYIESLGIVGRATVKRLVKGMVVREAALFPGVENGLPPLNGLIVYLDSTVVCKMLGFGPKEEQAYAVEAIRTLKNAGIAVRAFDITMREISGILRGVMECWGVPSPSFGPNAYSFQMPRNGFKLSDVNQIMMATSQYVARNARIRIDDDPPLDERYTFGAESLEERLRDTRGGFGNSSRIRHDVRCIESILTIRKDASSISSLKRCKALFVSDSVRTTGNITRWWKEDQNREDIPPIFSLGKLASYAWLLSSHDSGDELIDSAMLLACSSALLPSRAAWSRMQERLKAHVEEGSVSKEEVAAVILGTDLIGIMSEAEFETSKNGEEFVAYDEVIDAAKAELTRPLIEEYEQELAQRDAVRSQELANMAAQHDQAIGELSSRHAMELQKLKDEYIVLEKRAADAEQRNDELIRERHDRRVMVAVVVIKTIIALLTIAVCWLLWPTAASFIKSLTSDGSFNNATIVGIVFGAAQVVVGIAALLQGKDGRMYKLANLIITHFEAHS